MKVDPIDAIRVSGEQLYRATVERVRYDRVIAAAAAAAAAARERCGRCGSRLEERANVAQTHDAVAATSRDDDRRGKISARRAVAVD